MFTNELRILRLYLANVLIISSALLMSGVVSSAQESSVKPILRIEAGVHVGPIKTISVDHDNRYIVTASDDFTARIWDLETGKLLRVLRPPLGDNLKGRLQCATISPDGKVVAIGGWSAYQRTTNYFLYLFDRKSGKLARRIPDLQADIRSIVYSRDGKFIAVASRKGLSVFSTQDYRVVAEDNAYPKSCSEVDFDKSGRLVTTAGDGLIRLYQLADKNTPLQILARKEAPPGSFPLSVRFSSDGEKIAVSMIDNNGPGDSVQVLSGQNLSTLYAPQMNSRRERIGRLAWSPDGKFLYGGGDYRPAFNGFVRKWSNGGSGTYEDAPVTAEQVSDIQELKDGGIAFSSLDAALGTLDKNLHRKLFIGSQIAEFPDSQKTLLVSADAKIVQFNYESGSENSAQLSLPERSLTSATSRTAQLATPITQASGLRITGWYRTRSPRLNGKALYTSQFEVSHFLAVAPDEQRFLLGTTDFIRLYDKDGGQVWRIPCGGALKGINVSGNGKLAVAVTRDGILHWYRMRDAKEILSAFPHRDKRRWVYWTPKGYYDVSPGGDELIGWYLNQGLNTESEFFPISRFRNVYYRPDVIARVLEAETEDEALRLADLQANRKFAEIDLQKVVPPTVEIISPSDGTEVSNPLLTVTYSVHSASGEPVTKVSVLIDGRPIPINSRGLTVKPARLEEPAAVSISIPERDCELSLIAENRYSSSTPATVAIKWRGKVSDAEFTVKPKLYILAIGVSQYAEKEYSLAFADKDATDFATTMEKQRGGLYREVNVRVIANDHATKDEILDGLDWIRKETTSKDVAMVFLAGHGINDNNGMYYFLPFNTNLEKLLRTAIPFSDIKNTVATIAGKALFFVDTCHSGNVIGTRRGLADTTSFINELASSENGVVVFAASTGNQFSLENSEWGHGAFSKAVIEGLNGSADYRGSGRITVNMLDLYISERVKELTKGQQTPTTTKPQTIPDFPIAIKK